MSDETVCGRCRLPIHRDSPMQYFGTFVTHEPNECVRLLRAENERLLGRIDALCAESISFSTQCDTLRAENERLKTLEAAVRDLLFDADEYDCNGLGLHALHNAWSPVHKALDAIDAAMKEGER